jgi:glutamate carboxypeptidase
VFDEGTAAARPFRVEGHLAHGPGTSDMKGGLLAGFEAVEALQQTGRAPSGTITYVCNPDEEIGSPFSGPVIRELAAEHDVAFVLECARANGDVVSARKGVTDYTIDFLGRAAHAGVEPEKGASAVLAAAHVTIALDALNGRWPGVTVNVGVARGGSRTNVVPERSELHVDLRSPDERSMREAEEAIRAVCLETAVPGVEVVLREHGWHRPMERTPAGGELADLAIVIGKELGLEFAETATGGASDANTTSAAGVPTLDGLGPVGGDAHAEGEWLDLSSVPSRVALLATLIDRVGDL